MRGREVLEWKAKRLLRYERCRRAFNWVLCHIGIHLPKEKYVRNDQNDVVWSGGLLCVNCGAVLVEDWD